MKKTLAFNYFNIILILLCALSVKPILSQSFRGISPISEEEAWFSGSKGTILYTHDGAKSFDTLSPKKFKNKDFRDIHAIDKNSAVIMSVGDSAVILKTINHGRSWNVVYEDNRPGIFFDVIEINNQTGVGIALGDPLPDSVFNATDKTSIAKHFVALYTPDYGNHWYPIPNGTWNLATNNLSSMFAASGTSLVYNKLEFDQSKSNWTILMDFYFSGGGSQSAEIRQVILSFQMQQPKQTFEYLKFDYPLKFPSGDSWGIYGMQKINNRIFCFGGNWKYPNAIDSFCYVIHLSNVQYSINQHQIKSLIPTNSYQFPQTGYRSGGAMMCLPKTDQFLGLSLGSNGIDFIQTKDKISTKLNPVDPSLNTIKGANVCINIGNTFWIAGNKGLILRKTIHNLVSNR